MVYRVHLSCQHSTPGVPAPVAMTHRLQGQMSDPDPSTSGGSGSQKSVHGTGETGLGNTARACLWNDSSHEDRTEHLSRGFPKFDDAKNMLDVISKETFLLVRKKF